MGNQSPRGENCFNAIGMYVENPFKWALANEDGDLFEKNCGIL